MNEQIAESAVQEMRKKWGGSLPSWNYFKKAQKNGRVGANKTIAAQFAGMNILPKSYFILYGIITLWFGFFLFPSTLIAWFFFHFSTWWILGSIFMAWFLVKVSREGHCEGMKAAAEKNKKVYEILVNNGAFLFTPGVKKVSSEKPSKRWG